MDRSTVLYLLADTYTQNANGEFEPSGTARQVYGNIRSVSRAEFFAAGEEGLRAEYQVRMFAPDYQGEQIARIEIGGVMYQFKVYRTYIDANEQIELYLADRVGVSAVDLTEDDEPDTPPLPPAPTPDEEDENVDPD